MSLSIEARLRFIESLDIPPVETCLASKLAVVNAANQAGGDDKDKWYKKFKEVLENIGWVVESFSFTEIENVNTYGSVDKAVIAMLDPHLSPEAGEVVKATIYAMKRRVNAEANAIFQENAWDGQIADVRIGVASASDSDNVRLHIGRFNYAATGAAGNVLFFKFGHSAMKFVYTIQTMVLDEDIYKKIRDAVKKKLGTAIESYRKDVVIKV
ncbi:hypothetical protein BKA93DRAFT_260388 [Sparassis latifolia]